MTMISTPDSHGTVLPCAMFSQKKYGVCLLASILRIEFVAVCMCNELLPTAHGRRTTTLWDRAGAVLLRVVLELQGMHVP